MTQEIIFQTFGNGFWRGCFFDGKEFSITGGRKIFQVEAGSYHGCPSGLAGKSFDGALLVPTSGAFVTGRITNNGHIIYEEKAGPRSGIALTDLVIEELPVVALPSPPTPEPKPEECFIFANIFRFRGSTAQGAPPQEKVLVSSGKISCESADALRATGHIIEEIEEGEVAPPDVPSPTPQNPFYRDKQGNKIFITQAEAGRTLRVEIKESLGFREV